VSVWEHEHERLVDQEPERVDDVSILTGVGDGFDRVEWEAVGKHGEVPEESLFGRAEQVVAPGNHGFERPLSPERRA
jgi:hypothetical protein